MYSTQVIQWCNTTWHDENKTKNIFAESKLKERERELANVEQIQCSVKSLQQDRHGEWRLDIRHQPGQPPSCSSAGRWHQPITGFTAPAPQQLSNIRPLALPSCHQLSSSCHQSVSRQVSYSALLSVLHVAILKTELTLAETGKLSGSSGWSDPALLSAVTAPASSQISVFVLFIWSSTSSNTAL